MNSSLVFTILDVSCTNSEFFFTCGPGNEERCLILGDFIQNRKNTAPVRNSLMYVILRVFTSIILLLLNLPSDSVQGIIHSQRKSLTQFVDTTNNLIQSIFSFPTTYSQLNTKYELNDFMLALRSQIFSQFCVKLF